MTRVYWFAKYLSDNNYFWNRANVHRLKKTIQWKVIHKIVVKHAHNAPNRSPYNILTFTINNYVNNISKYFVLLYSQIWVIPLNINRRAIRYKLVLFTENGKVVYSSSKTESLIFYQSPLHVFIIRISHFHVCLGVSNLLSF